MKADAATMAKIWPVPCASRSAMRRWHMKKVNVSFMALALSFERVAKLSVP